MVNFSPLVRACQKKITLSFFVSLKYNQGLNLRTSTLWNKQEALITEPLQGKEPALFP